MTTYLQRFDKSGDTQRLFAFFIAGRLSIRGGENKVYVNVTPEQMAQFKASPDLRTGFEQWPNSSDPDFRAKAETIEYQDDRHILVEIPSDEGLAERIAMSGFNIL